MSVVKEFKEFINKGNVVDLAIGVVIGAAFGKIIEALVNDIISPIIGLIIGQTDFSAWKITMKEAMLDAAGKEIPAVTLNVGSFLETTVDFLIVAAVIFMVVKGVNRMKRKQAETAPPPAPSKQEMLLTEIRDLLKK